MAYVIIGDLFAFPEGNAATNRVHTYAKGFYENGQNVHVICFESEYDTVGDGVIDGIYFYHPFGQRKRNKYFVIRRYHKLLKYLRTIKLIKRINEKEKIISINIWTNLFLTHLFAWFSAKICKTKLIVECSEYPLRHYQNGALEKKLGILKFYLESNLCDGVFCISQFLIDFYIKHGINPRKLFLVPSTVDTERFNRQFNSPLSFKYILYCGTLTILKDGVNILIESFTKISEKYPEINLVLIGKSASLKDEIIIKDLLATLNIDKRIFLLGQLSRTEIPAYLTNAKILALARPQSIVADAGFPSKLTEYLATGNPVVVTKVGEIPVYLKDNENAFLSDPDSVDAFADKLDFVLSNYDLAQQVGAKGKELTRTIFNYNFQARRMLEFTASIS
jgi:glycosyltransferase involved in cell wall biosynthesis